MLSNSDTDFFPRAWRKPHSDNSWFVSAILERSSEKTLTGATTRKESEVEKKRERIWEIKNVKEKMTEKKRMRERESFWSGNCTLREQTYLHSVSSIDFGALQPKDTTCQSDYRTATLYINVTRRDSKIESETRPPWSNRVTTCAGRDEIEKARESSEKYFFYILKAKEHVPHSLGGSLTSTFSNIPAINNYVIHRVELF